MDLEEMVNWQTWCCLCAKPDQTRTIRFHSGDESSQDMNIARDIEKYFGINITRNKSLATMLCIKCFDLILSLNKFCERAIRVQRMFDALQHTADITKNDYNEVRLKYGVQQIGDTGLVLAEQLMPEVSCSSSQPEQNEASLDANEKNYIGNTKNPLELPSMEIKLENREETLEVMKEFNGKDDDKNNVDDNDVYLDRTVSNKMKYEEEQEAEDLDTDAKHLEQIDITDDESQNDSKIMCSECPAKFKRSQSYKIHMKRVHLITLPPSEFQCTQCQRVFTMPCELKRHLTMHEPLEVRSVLPCKYCNKKFFSKYSLQRHMLIHTGEKPYKCNVCPKEFRDKSKLKLHMRKDHFANKTNYDEIATTKNTFEDDELDNNVDLTKSNSTMNECETERKESNNNKDGFPCQLCYMKFRWKFSLQRHMLLHTGEKPYKCVSCPRAFRDKSKLKDHERKYHHSKQDSLEQSSTEKELHTLNIDDDEADISSTSTPRSGVGVTYGHELEGKQYEGTLNEKGPFSCRYCDKTFRWKHSALRHIFLHTGQKPFKCEICPQAFRQNARLKEHIKRYHSNEQGSLESPFEENRDQSDINNIPKELEITSGPTLTNQDGKELCADTDEDEDGMLNKNDPITCSKCPQTFKRMQSYRLHMTRKHSMSLPPSQFPCKQCTRIFKFECDLRVHLKMHIPLEARRVLPCQFCDKKFLTNDAVRKHVRHFHMNERYYICEECGMELRSTVSLRVHMMRHTDERPFKCDICHRSYREKSKLKMHMETHDVNKKVCPECGRQFNSTLNLRVHMKVHSDDRRFKCDYCGKTFKRSRTLKAHLILHTGLKPFSCNFCDRTFSTGSSCRLHKKTQHPQELAALEAAGGGAVYACAVPTLETLKAIAQTSDNLRPVGSKESKT